MLLNHLFNYKLTRLSQYVDAEHLDAIKEAFIIDLETNTQRLSQMEVERFIHFLFNYIREDIEEAEKINTLMQGLRKHLSHSSSDFEKQKIILDYAYRFNPSKKERHKDERAFRRWFDEDALSERIKSRISYLHRRIIVALERVSSSIEILEQEQEITEPLWHSFDFNKHFLQLLQYRQEDQLTHKAFSVLIDLVQRFEIHEHMALLDEKLFRFIYKVSLSVKENVWVQNGAIEFLFNTQLSSFTSIVKIRSAVYNMDDSIFVRHKIAELACKSAADNIEMVELIKKVILKDPSSYVRQGLVRQIPYITHPELEMIKEELLLHDPEKSVRALAVLQALEPFSHTQAQNDFRSLVWKSLVNETESFVIKTILHTIRVLAERSAQSKHPDTEFMEYSLHALSLFMNTGVETSLKRYAATVREFVWACSDMDRYMTYEELYGFVRKITPGKGKRVSKKYTQMERDELYRILSVIAQNDFSLELRHKFFKGLVLYRADRFGRRLWRVIYEFLNPSPDKRQAFFHTIARIFEGTHHFPSAILAEQAPTKVPGEPYLIPEEESWRPYLPLPDHFLSSLKQSTLRIYPYEIYSSDGVTRIEPPKFFLNRIRVELLLSWNYSKIARLRNWQSSFTEAPSAYITAMHKLGFKTSFTPYIKDDKSTSKFFPVAIPFVSDDFQESLGNYFVSAYENSLSDLILFLVCIFGIFFIRHLLLSRKIVRARKNIPLSIGGWGTRGKSGTERLKAALFNSLGLRVFSKTTGNEAMFLHSDSFESMREMYLFRPYDKATIWEQADVLLLADKLNIDVFLWESMGLTPSYVEVLQQQWMKDDIATITNTYPDHEDLQGPAGINIPQVMTKFIPKGSKLITTEEVMYPILSSHAQRVNSQSHQVGWLEAGLISPDILERFPYEEHPHNIALVLRMAEELDINEDEALKAMADHIVPDLGVLKAYPPSHIDNRSLEFINGMSANERFGALGNWKRMSLDKIDDETDPDIFITTVINNRADRVSRSRVFASMIVEDVVADCHILIGSNLSGFDNYLEEAWLNYQGKLSLRGDEESSSYDKLMNYAKKFRITRNTQQLKQRLGIMLNALDIDPDLQNKALECYSNEEELQVLLKDLPEVLKFYTRVKIEHDEFEELLALVQKNEERDKLDQTFRDQLWKWLKSRVLPINNYHASGNEIIKVLSDYTPIGMKNKIIGMQNIKGTGLDFAYRWVAWDQCYHICEAVKSSDSSRVREGVDALAAFGEHGPLTFTLAQESIAIAKRSIATQSEYYQAQLQLAQESLNAAVDEFSKLDISSVHSASSSKFWHKLLGVIESFLDAGDAVKRRKRANRIYKDLVSHRISHKKAAFELQLITQRQKGGWFTQKFDKRVP